MVLSLANSQIIFICFFSIFMYFLIFYSFMNKEKTFKITNYDEELKIIIIIYTVNSQPLLSSRETEQKNKRNGSFLKQAIVWRSDPCSQGWSNTIHTHRVVDTPPGPRTGLGKSQKTMQDCKVGPEPAPKAWS